MAENVAREEREVFANYLAKNRLKRSDQREAILDVFPLRVSVDDLFHPRR